MTQKYGVRYVIRESGNRQDKKTDGLQKKRPLIIMRKLTSNLLRMTVLAMKETLMTSRTESIVVFYPEFHYGKDSEARQLLT